MGPHDLDPFGVGGSDVIDKADKESFRDRQKRTKQHMKDNPYTKKETAVAGALGVGSGVGGALLGWNGANAIDETQRRAGKRKAAKGIDTKGLNRSMRLHAADSYALARERKQQGNAKSAELWRKVGENQSQWAKDAVKSVENARKTPIRPKAGTAGLAAGGAALGGASVAGGFALERKYNKRTGFQKNDPFEVEKAFFNPAAIKRGFTSAGGGLKGAKAGANIGGRQFRRAITGTKFEGPAVSAATGAKNAARRASASVQANPMAYAAGGAAAGGAGLGVGAGYQAGKKKDRNGLGL